MCSTKSHLLLQVHSRPRVRRRPLRRAPIVFAAATTGRTQHIVQNCEKYVLHTYPRPELVLSHGSGAYLYDVEGRRYLDFTTGIAVNALGHSDPRWVQTIENQASKLTHTANLFHTEPAVELAKRLVENSFAQKVFFTNSGTEANEAAIKFARKHATLQKGLDPYDPQVVPL